MQRIPLIVAGPGQQVYNGAQPAAGPWVYYQTDSSDRWRFATGLFVGIPMLILFLLGCGWAIETGVINQNWGFCRSQFCQNMEASKLQADINSELAQAPAIVVPPPPAPPAVVVPAAPPQQIIMQPQAPTNVIVPPAPQTRVIEPRQQGCPACMRFGTVAGPAVIAQPRVIVQGQNYVQPRRVYTQQQHPQCAQGWRWVPPNNCVREQQRQPRFTFPMPHFRGLAFR